MPISRRSFLSAATATAATTLAATRPLSAALAHGFARFPESGNTAPTTRRLDTGWEFFRGSLDGPWETWHAEELAVFTPVTLPHSVNANDACDPDQPYYRGPAWYRTRLSLDNPFPSGRTLLHFLGAGQVTDVFVGLTPVAHHEGGYDEWVADLTDAAARWSSQATPAERAKGVPLSIRCDNSRNLELIPSDFSDFSLYGGIYRPVDLVYLPLLALESVHLPVAIRPDRSAHIRIRARLYNPARLDLSTSTPPGESAIRIAVQTRVTSPSGKLLQDFDHMPQAADPATGDLPCGDFEIPAEDFAFWSPASPNLFRCEITLKSPHGTHTVTHNLGLREFRFEEHGPFFLNGERLLLQGTHRHEDHAGLANAMPEPLIREEMRLIKAMGANFIRLGHYQQHRLVLDLCDELGLLAWEELPWCRAGVGDDHWKAMSRDKLRNMIEQHRNHPSVILWGLGNEDDWPTEFPQPLDAKEKDAIRAWMTELRDLAHQLDPSRLTSFRRCDFARDIPDVYSPSIWAGWYSGLYTEYEASLTRERDRVRHMLHIEWGADSLAGRHAEDPYTGLHIATGQGTDERGLAYKNSGGPPRISRDGDWSETYACDLFDWHLKTQQSLPWLTGAAQWIFKDFTTPLRVENPIPRINMKGVVTRDLQPKESYFVFQSYWAAEPMLHLYGQTWPTRWGAPHEEKTLKVYSNCDEVELFELPHAPAAQPHAAPTALPAGARSLGTRKRNPQDFPAAGLRWKTTFNPGPNHFRAIGRKNGVTVTGDLTFTYEITPWTAPAHLQLRELHRGPGARITVEATLHDAQNRLCLDSRQRIRFTAAGPATLLDNQGTPWASRVIELANGRARITTTLAGLTATVAVQPEPAPNNPTNPLPPITPAFLAVHQTPQPQPGQQPAP